VTVAPGAAPFPPHVAQVSVIGTSIGTLPPSTAVRKSTVSMTSIESPRRSSPRFPRPKIEEKQVAEPAQIAEFEFSGVR
jgi:hypothetical protein